MSKPSGKDGSAKQRSRKARYLIQNQVLAQDVKRRVSSRTNSRSLGRLTSPQRSPLVPQMSPSSVPSNWTRTSLLLSSQPRRFCCRQLRNPRLLCSMLNFLPSSRYLLQFVDLKVQHSPCYCMCSTLTGYLAAKSQSSRPFDDSSKSIPQEALQETRGFQPFA